MRLPVNVDLGPPEPLDPELSLIRQKDVIAGWLTLALAIASFVTLAAMVFVFDMSVYESIPVIAIPFFVTGSVSYIIGHRFVEALAIVGISVVFYLIDPALVIPLLYILVCAGGVAITVEIIQRLLFYRILRSVEQVNSKRRLNLFDKVVVFLFNIPCDLDTRNLLMDHQLRRSGLPWKDMFYTMMLALCLCVFLWIYMFLNPAFAVDTPGALIHTFTIILYVQVLVMPWGIFGSLNVRVGTEFRDFRLYSGLLETTKRMFLPAMLALLFLAVAFSSGSYTLYYVAMSIVMIVVTCVFASAVYYTRNEASVVNDITSRWRAFHPVDMYSGFGEETASSRDAVPGTPTRDPRSCFRDFDQK